MANNIEEASIDKYCEVLRSKGDSAIGEKNVLILCEAIRQLCTSSRNQYERICVITYKEFFHIIEDAVLKLDESLKTIQDVMFSCAAILRESLLRTEKAPGVLDKLMEIFISIDSMTGNGLTGDIFQNQYLISYLPVFVVNDVEKLARSLAKEIEFDKQDIESKRNGFASIVSDAEDRADRIKQKLNFAALTEGFQNITAEKEIS